MEQSIGGSWTGIAGSPIETGPTSSLSLSFQLFSFSFSKLGPLKNQLPPSTSPRCPLSLSPLLPSSRFLNLFRLLPWTDASFRLISSISASPKMDGGLAGSEGLRVETAEAPASGAKPKGIGSEPPEEQQRRATKVLRPDDGLCASESLVHHGTPLMRSERILSFSSPRPELTFLAQDASGTWNGSLVLAKSFYFWIIDWQFLSILRVCFLILWDGVLGNQTCSKDPLWFAALAFWLAWLGPLWWTSQEKHVYGAFFFFPPLLGVVLVVHFCFLVWLILNFSEMGLYIW